MIWRFDGVAIRAAYPCLPSRLCSFARGKRTLIIDLTELCMTPEELLKRFVSLLAHKDDMVPATAARREFSFPSMPDA